MPSLLKGDISFVDNLISIWKPKIFLFWGKNSVRIVRSSIPAYTLRDASYYSLLRFLDSNLKAMRWVKLSSL